MKDKLIILAFVVFGVALWFGTIYVAMLVAHSASNTLIKALVH